MKKIFLFFLFQFSFLVGFSQTDTVEVDTQTDTLKVIHKNEIGVDVSPLLIKAMSLDRTEKMYSNVNSFNFFYKRNIRGSHYLRTGFSFVDKSVYNPIFNPVYNTTFTYSPIFSSSSYNLKSKEIFGYFGYEKRFTKNYIQPFISIDLMVGRYESNDNILLYDLNDTLYPINYTTPQFDSTTVFNSGSVSLVKYQNSNSYNSTNIGLLFRAGFMVDLSKRFYLLMQTGGSARILFGESNSTYPTIDPSKATKISLFNFELLRNNTNLMIGYRF